VATNVQKRFGMGSKKITLVHDTKTTFDNVKGCDEVKEELDEIICYLKQPQRFTRLGAKLPKGMLLCGQPGTGKTLLARAIAGEAKVPFIQATGSEFEEMFVGVGARRIRDLFAAARQHAPCIVFIDEIDAVGSKRSSRDQTGIRMTLNQLLVELDGFEQNQGIVVICATNLPESLDPALTRPGRLDKVITVPLPDLQGRQEILDLYGEKVILSNDVDLSILARRTAGMTGADLFNIINIAAVKSSAENKSSITMESLELSMDRVMVGLERRNPMSEMEKEMTAYHESGHALVSIFTPGTTPVHKATIMPRGNTLGVTWQIPDSEKYQQRLFELKGRLDTLMGGKAAEEVVFGPQNVTAGCTSDLLTATKIARTMVMQFGMGASTSSPISVDEQTYGMISEKAREKIDAAVEDLLNESYQRARSILIERRRELDDVAKALIENETLSREEISLAIEGKGGNIITRRKEKLVKPTSPRTGKRFSLISSTEGLPNTGV